VSRVDIAVFHELNQCLRHTHVELGASVEHIPVGGLLGNRVVRVHHTHQTRKHHRQHR